MVKISDPIALLFLVPFIAAVGFLVNVDNKSALEFEAEGKVVFASWEGRNHGMPLFIIRQYDPAGTERKLENSDVLLRPNQIKVGDHFKKLAGSKACSINELEVQCIK